MLRELFGRSLMIAGSWIAYYWAWWAPLLAAPLIWQAFDIFCLLADSRRGLKEIDKRLSGSKTYQIARPPFPGLSDGQRLLLDAITWGFYLTYIILAVYLCGINIGHWYGWIIGVAVAISVAQLLALLFPHRWHKETLIGK